MGERPYARTDGGPRIENRLVSLPEYTLSRHLRRRASATRLRTQATKKTNPRHAAQPSRSICWGGGGNSGTRRAYAIFLRRRIRLSERPSPEQAMT